MAKNYSNKNRKRKALIAMLCALSITCTGLAAACAPTEEETPSTAVTSKEDTQLIKNGDFEHFDIPDKAIHLIKNVNNWTLGGDNSVKSGIIGTSKSDWDKLTDGELADTLNLNNDLSTDSEDYVNYNNMRSRDILYKDTYAATLEADKVKDSYVDKYTDLSGGDIHGYQGYFGIKGTGTSEDPYKLNDKTVYYNSDDKEFYFDEGYTELVRKELIENPGTHYDLNEDETKVTVDGKEYDVLKDEDSGNLYYKDGDGNENYFSNVLMIHNASTNSDNNGIQQYYTSNTVSLEAHTSAEISLWVKTSDLRFDKGYFATAKQEDLGAYIEVLQTVASTTVDSFKIKAINTQNIIATAKEKGEPTTESNGWIKYTVYVNACDFANTSIQLRLGLGGSEWNEKVSGYAFFDDVQIKKYRTLDADETECTYKDHKAEIETNKTSCTLTSEEEEKIFYADVTTKWEKELHYNDFHYLIDLASIMDNDSKHNYSPIAFGNNVEVGLTTEKNSKDVEYAAATRIDANNEKITVNKKGEPVDGYKLPKDVKERPTNEDIIKVLGNNEDFGKYSKLLNNVTGENSAPELLDGNNGNTLLIFSAWGAPYTATLTDNTTFTLPNASTDGKEGYLLVSFWVKTSDMDGSTAATAKIYELDKKTGLVNEDSVKTLTIDTTDNKTDFEDEKDIYNGWVQCFFFVKNDAKDKDDDGNYREKTFKIDLSFGTTSIISTTSYQSGYAAFANLQVLKINEDIYKLASESTTTALFSFAKESEKDSGKYFDKATGTDDVNDKVALPDSYKGVNGANVLGSSADKDAPRYAGLINKDVFNDENSVMTATEKDRILKSFSSTATKWENVFGENCYQPLIIINSLREYAQRAEPDEDTFDNGNYYIENEDGTYSKVEAGAEYNKDTKYYSLAQVANYGFVGNQKTVSANGREVVSVRVKVTGNAEAYIYLVNGDDTDKILNFTTPSYTFWYDEEGNVLDKELDEDWTTAEHREHIVYTLREDGLYDGKDGDGKLYGNLYNLVKSYKDSKYEQVSYYDEDGNPVEGGYDYVEKHDGETFYKTTAGKNGEISDHYLCTTDGTHVYEYIDGKYYYVEITKTDDKTTETTNKDLEVNNFDAEKYARYSNPDIDEKLFVKVTKDDCDRLGDDGWVTVNFVVKAGSEEKSYRLELWSGSRDDDGVTKNGDDYDYVKGAVAFDYSHKTVSENTLTTYEKEIINAYNSAFNNVVPDLLKEESSLGRDANIADYEAILNSDKLTDAEKTDIKAEMASYTYKASYYTYTLYDSAAYVPFNATTAGDGETGYDYDASSFSEQLAYFEFEDTANNEMNIFVDYSAVDQSISKSTLPDEDDTDEEETTNATELGLYISSIVLVVVLLITLVSILVTQYIRKRRKASGPKNSNKNVYRKRDRYVKKLHLVKDEMVEPENAENAADEVPAEEVTPVENEAGEDKE